MKVKDLIEFLEFLPGEMDVILQKDEEGNGYERLYTAYTGYSDGVFGAEGVVYDIDSTAEDNCLDDLEWEEIKKNEPQVLVLSP